MLSPSRRYGPMPIGFAIKEVVMLKVLHAVLVLALAPAWIYAQTGVHDFFDRANSGNLGPDWSEIDADAQITNNALQANTPFQFGWSAFTAFSAPRTSTVVKANWYQNGGGDALSLIVGANTSTWAAIEARLSDNTGGGLANRLFLNASVNAGNWFGGPIFFNLAMPRASGEMTLWFINGGATAQVLITDIGGGNPENFSAGGIPAGFAFGTSVGVGYFGNGRIDEFRAWVGSPTGPVETINPPRTNQPVTILVTGAAPSAALALGFSLTGGSGPLTGIGPVLLSEPINLFGIFPADTNGRLLLPLGNVPPGLVGTTIWQQALDLTTPALSNGFSSVFL